MSCAIRSPILVTLFSLMAVGYSYADTDNGEHWAFRPFFVIDPPAIEDAHIRTPIDSFVISRLAEQGLTLSEEADRSTLLRRVSFDLTGLPPTPAEIATYLADHADGAYQRMIERYLRSPHYGERWGGHWLDTSGYADSNGYFNADTDRPLAYRYRDYVIRAMNSDKPFDRFVREQLAGDELAELTGYQPEGQVTAQVIELFEATHYLRNSQDGTDSSDGNPDELKIDKYKVLEGTLQMIGASLLGLKLQCARCHEHKYEPIEHREYYQLQAIFYPALNVDHWIKPKDRMVYAALAKNLAAWKVENGRIDAEVAAVKQAFDQWNRDNGEAGMTSDEKRKTNHSVVDSAAREKYQAALVVRKKQRDEAIAALDAQRTVHPGKIAWVSESGPEAPLVFCLERGEYNAPQEQVPPATLDVLAEENNPALLDGASLGLHRTSGRRLAFAQWLTRPDSKAAALLARVTVNRIWQHHFGTGIVSTSDNLGLSGATPTHPRLLDWLAQQFVQSGWSMKNLHRLILTSATYRQASTVNATTQPMDPNNRLLGRFPLRRLDAESLRDAMLSASGELDGRMGGPYIPTSRRSVSEVSVDESTNGAHRRSIYLQRRRSQIESLLTTFDAPSIVFNCVRRDSTTVPLQSLTLLNSDFIRLRAHALARRLQHEIGDNLDARLEQAFLLVMGRPPTTIESKESHQFLADQPNNYPNRDHAEQLAWVDFCQMLLASSPFLYVE